MGRWGRTPTSGLWPATSHLQWPATSHVQVYFKPPSLNLVRHQVPSRALLSYRRRRFDPPWGFLAISFKGGKFRIFHHARFDPPCGSVKSATSWSRYAWCKLTRRSLFQALPRYPSRRFGPRPGPSALSPAFPPSCSLSLSLLLSHSLSPGRTPRTCSTPAHAADLPYACCPLPHTGALFYSFSSSVSPTRHAPSHTPAGGGRGFSEEDWNS